MWKKAIILISTFLDRQDERIEDRTSLRPAEGLMVKLTEKLFPDNHQT